MNACVLVIAEHNNQQLKPSSLATITAAAALAPDIHILVAGHTCDAVAKQAAIIAGITKVWLADAASYQHALAENLVALIQPLAKPYTHILAPATAFGKNVLPRLAALLDVQPVSDVIHILAADTFVHPIYAGNALETVQSHDAIKLLTIRTTAFSPAKQQTTAAPIETLTSASEDTRVQWLSMQESISERPELTAARVVVAGGRGLGSAENFKLLEKIANKLGAALGASRAAVDAGYAPNDWQVGQTGKVVAPDLYIAVGISGAIQHLAGMKDSKVIVAINKDADASIFQVADYGLVGDLFQILPELERLLPPT